MARLLLQLITTEATSPLNQSEFLSNAWNLLKARAKSRAQVAIGFGFGFGFAFASHWLKNGREIFKPTTIRHCYLKATLSTSLHLPWSWMLKYSYSSSGDPKYFLAISGNINFYNHSLRLIELTSTISDTRSRESMNIYVLYLLGEYYPNLVGRWIGIY